MYGEFTRYHLERYWLLLPSSASQQTDVIYPNYPTFASICRWGKSPTSANPSFPTRDKVDGGLLGSTSLHIHVAPTASAAARRAKPAVSTSKTEPFNPGGPGY